MYFALTPWSQVLPSSLVDCSLNVHCVSSRALYWLWPIKQSSRLPDILQGVADELWFSVTKGPLVTTSPSVIEYRLPFLTSLVSFLVKVIIQEFGCQCFSAVWECCFWFTSKQQLVG